MSNSDLFDDYTPTLKECDGCKQSFEESKLSRCKLCGKYFCPECRKTHDCRTEASKNKDTEDNIDANTNYQTINYERCLKYFKNNLDIYSNNIFIGFIILIIGFCILSASIAYELNAKNPSILSPDIVIISICFAVPGALIMIIGSINRAKEKKRIPTDKEMDETAHGYGKYKTDLILKNIYDKLGIDESQADLTEPYITADYHYDKIGDCGYMSRKGYQDLKHSVSSNYQIIILMLTEDQLLIYNYLFSLINKDAAFENSREIFYSDIVSVNSEATIKTNPISNKPRYHESFEVRMGGLNRFKFSTFEDDEEKIEKFRNIVRAMKQLVRDKKNQDDFD